MFDLTGAPAAIGQAYGETCRDEIRANLRELVFREGFTPLPREEFDFQAWVLHQEGLLEKHWPWLLEEMTGVAAACGVEHKEILLLNLRAWQYEYYGLPPAGARVRTSAHEQSRRVRVRGRHPCRLRTGKGLADRGPRSSGWH
ncbi:MAG TPA: hypothetical protein QGH10_25555 [Armatimonadota bacterium]|nr:hypothetical protein [Armatimonadota bacterium]